MVYFFDTVTYELHSSYVYWALKIVARDVKAAKGKSCGVLSLVSSLTVSPFNAALQVLKTKGRQFTVHESEGNLPGLAGYPQP